MIISIEGTIGTNKNHILHELSKLLPDENYCLSADPYQQFSCYKNKCNPLNLLYSLPFEYSGFTQVHINKVLYDHFRQIKHDHILNGKNV